jgi:hypothetical protein
MIKVWSPESGFKVDDIAENKSADSTNVNAFQQFYR